jgi:hypothetical protein
MKAQTTIDRVGISLSSLCILHCLLLPMLATILPFFGVISEIEWVHKSLVLFAIPAAMTLILSRTRFHILAFASLGLILIVSAAFWKPFHDLEVVLTVIGASLLCAAHMLRLKKAKHLH